MSKLLLSGFADEAAIDKTIDQQLSAIAAAGLFYLSIRFVDVGNGIKNIMELSEEEFDIVRRKLDKYDLKISSIGSPIGKVKLLDVDDGTANRFFPFDEYMDQHVEKVCRIAKTLDCKCIRGFSFYHPKGTPPENHIEQAAEQLRQIAEMCDSYALTFGLEVEANLIGQNANLLAQLHSLVDSEAMVLIFDGANLITQGYSKAESIQQFDKMKSALGWLHIKDHVATHTETGSYVDEEALSGFVPAGRGASGYPEILAEFKSEYENIKSRVARRGLPGVFADLEPHLKGGGQFGGFSGPDGFGIAVRAFCKLCEEADISFAIRNFDSAFSRVR